MQSSKKEEGPQQLEKPSEQVIKVKAVVAAVKSANEAATFTSLQEESLSAE